MNVAVAISSIVAIAFAILYFRSEQKLRKSEQQAAEMSAAKARLEGELGALKSKLESDERQLETFKELLGKEFKVIANDIFESNNKKLKETNQESLETLLRPFKTNITEFRERVEKIHSEETLRSGELRNELKRLQDQNRLISDQANALTTALKGNSKVQGDFGEVLLERILEDSGLIEGVGYKRQPSYKDEGGNLQRPDVVVMLPDGKEIVIDAKMSLTNYVQMVESEDDTERATQLKAHILSVKRHIDTLGEKSYQKLLNSPDFVILFVANEPAFLTAMQNDNSLWSYGYNKKVIVSSPTNLFALLKIVNDLWQRDAQSKNALEIANAGGALYDKFVLLVDSMEAIKKGIVQTQKSYDEAMGRLSEGRGNLLSQAERMKSLGAKATKSLKILPNEDN